MLRILSCIGGTSPASTVSVLPPSLAYDSKQKNAASTISRYARGRSARKTASALRERADAKATLNSAVRKQSRRGMGMYSSRKTMVSDDERFLYYCKPNHPDEVKELPFADMEAATYDGSVVTVVMRNQAKTTCVYKFSCGSTAAAKEWCDAINVYVPRRTPSGKHLLPKPIIVDEAAGAA